MYSVSPSVISTSRAAAGGAGGAGAGATGAMMGGAGVCGSSTAVAAFGAGTGSRMAISVGGGGSLGVGVGVGNAVLGEGMAGEGGGATLGGSISMMRVKISTGTIISAARRSRPFCSAHNTATCKTTTLAAIRMLRFKGGRTGVVVSTGGGQTREGMSDHGESSGSRRKASRGTGKSRFNGERSTRVG